MLVGSKNDFKKPRKRQAEDAKSQMKQPTIIISAMTRALVIGNDAGDGLPWNVPDEYNKFLGFIDKQAVVMGRKSFEIFKGDMSSSEKFVVSRSNISVPGATVCPSLITAIDKARETGRIVYVAGGGSIYDQAVPLVDKMYLSYMKGDFTGNTLFPRFDESQWQVTRREDHPEFEFVVYERV